MYEYAVIWAGIGTISTAIAADRRGFRGWSLVIWVMLGAILGIFGFLLALASSGGQGNDRAFRLSNGKGAVASPATAPPPTLPPAGWYADPTTPGGLRYWDGTEWTQRVAAASPQPSAAPST